MHTYSASSLLSTFLMVSSELSSLKTYFSSSSFSICSPSLHGAEKPIAMILATEVQGLFLTRLHGMQTERTEGLGLYTKSTPQTVLPHTNLCFLCLNLCFSPRAAHCLHTSQRGPPSPRPLALPPWKGSSAGGESSLRNGTRATPAADPSGPHPCHGHTSTELHAPFSTSPR